MTQIELLLLTFMPSGYLLHSECIHFLAMVGESADAVLLCLQAIIEARCTRGGGGNC